MGKKIQRWAIASTVFFVVCAGLLILNYFKEEPKLISSDEASPAAEEAFSDTEKQDVLDDISDKRNNIEILDSIFGNKSMPIFAAAVCRDLDTGSETGLAIVTKKGMGFIDLASEALDFKYYAKDGIKLSSSNTIELSLINSATNEIQDCCIEVNEIDSNVNYIINSTVRN